MPSQNLRTLENTWGVVEEAKGLGETRHLNISFPSEPLSRRGCYYQRSFRVKDGTARGLLQGIGMLFVRGRADDSRLFHQEYGTAFIGKYSEEQVLG